VNLLGRHQVINALLALAAAAEFGVSPEAARRGLEACAPPKMRLQVWRIGGITVLDDAYNANADSMLAALDTLRDYPCRHRRIAVLGDMAELGDFTAQAHAEAGRKAAESGVDWLVTVGRWAKVTAEAARASGLKRVNDFPTAQGAGQALREAGLAGDVILLKASRVSALEQVGEALRSGTGGG
jgi:UDP-N-acetylmuramoyl-tripeptide--D-alanyl-D-alanine ligase